jgi:hypothetical protein
LQVQGDTSVCRARAGQTAAEGKAVPQAEGRGGGFAPAGGPDPKNSRSTSGSCGEVGRFCAAQSIPRRPFQRERLGGRCAAAGRSFGGSELKPLPGCALVGRGRSCTVGFACAFVQKQMALLADLNSCFVAVSSPPPGPPLSLFPNRGRQAGRAGEKHDLGMEMKQPRKGSNSRGLCAGALLGHLVTVQRLCSIRGRVVCRGLVGTGALLDHLAGLCHGTGAIVGSSGRPCWIKIQGPCWIIWPGCVKVQAPCWIIWWGCVQGPCWIIWRGQRGQLAERWNV